MTHACHASLAQADQGGKAEELAQVFKGSRLCTEGVAGVEALLKHSNAPATRLDRPEGATTVGFFRALCVLGKACMLNSEPYHLSLAPMIMSNA